LIKRRDKRKFLKEEPIKESFITEDMLTLLLILSKRQKPPIGTPEELILLLRLLLRLLKLENCEQILLIDFSKIKIKKKSFFFFFLCHKKI
jgi:hypothetical protein